MHGPCVGLCTGTISPLNDFHWGSFFLQTTQVIQDDSHTAQAVSICCAFINTWITWLVFSSGFPPAQRDYLGFHHWAHFVSSSVNLLSCMHPGQTLSVLVKLISTDPGYGRRSYYRSPLLLWLAQLILIIVQILHRKRRQIVHLPQEQTRLDLKKKKIMAKCFVWAIKHARH